MRNKATLRIICACAAAALLLGGALYFALRPDGDAGDFGVNLLENGNFAAVDSNGLPKGWYTDAYFLTAGLTEYAVLNEDGAHAARIQNHALNDARFAQEVAVSPGAVYCLSGLIRAKASEGLGANLSIAGVYVFSESVFDTEGEWREVRLYGRTGEKQTAVTVFARLGGYGGEALGEAQFRDVSLVRVENAPEGMYVYNWYAAQTAAPQTDKDGAEGRPAWPLLVLIALLYLLLCGLMARSALGGEAKPARFAVPLLCGVLLAALAVRLAVAVHVPGYGVDVGCFTAWANMMAQDGAANFYASGSFCDYPPGYMLVLGVLGWIGRLLGTGATQTLIKLPSIACDLAAATVIFAFARPRVGDRAALTLGALYAFNPLTVLAGAAWGQADSVMALCILLVVILALSDRWIAALPVYMLAVLMKPQALMFGPLGLLALILSLTRGFTWRRLYRALAGAGLAIALAAAVILPFSPKMDDRLWFITLYANTMGYYANATVNACNVYFLFGQNWAGVQEAAPVLPRLLSMALMSAGMIALGLRGRWLRLNRASGRTNIVRFSALCAFALPALVLPFIPMTYSVFGTCVIVYAVLGCGAMYAAGGALRHLPLAGAALLLALCNFGTMMHERYLFAAVPLLLLASVTERDRRVYALFALVTASVFLNVGCVLDRGVRIGGVAGHLDAPIAGIASDSAALEYIVSAVNCLLAGYALYVTAAVCCAGKVAPWRDRPSAQSAPRFSRAADSILLPARPKRMERRDYLLMLTVTAAYAVVALTNLGAAASPQTWWRAQSPEESVVLDLGSSRAANMLYLGGIHTAPCDFVVQVSDDGEIWGEPYPAEMLEGNCFQWKYLTQTYDLSGEIGFSVTPLELTGRYVRISAQRIGLTLYEVILRDPQTKERLPLTLVSGAGEALIDEQEAFAGEPDWFNSAYFDEIYHARTGYEHYLAMQGDYTYHPYETTHPPLGKVLIAFSISVFGMTPFGWRFAGAVAGILMLPGMYMLGKLLTRRRVCALAAMLLMALDCMHFTQTRIATIDSFVVLFIVWSAACMAWYVQLDYWHTPFIKTLIPLALSGLFMGLAVASKWTGCYAGAGLAAVFFWSALRRLSESLHARRALRADKGKRGALPRAEREAYAVPAMEGLWRLGATLLCCLLFFIAVPLLIYYLSYIPYFLPMGGVTVQKVIQAAVGDYFTTGVTGGMLGYHTIPGLGLNHPFYSPWYQWPVIGKPMWFFGGSYEPAGYAQTIVSMGNPAVWWGGLLALMAVDGLWIAGHRGHYGPVLFSRRNDMRPALLLIFFAAQYLPWVLVERGTYIYHYFASLPFIILCVALCFDRLLDAAERVNALSIPAWPQRFIVRLNGWFGRESGERLRARAQGTRTVSIARWPVYLLYAYCFVALALFIAFFPYASGRLTATKWLDAMQWFSNWIYY